MLKTVPCSVCSILYRIKVMPCCPGQRHFRSKSQISSSLSHSHHLWVSWTCPDIHSSNESTHEEVFNLVCKCRWKVLYITPRDLDKCLDWYETKFFIYVLDIFLNPFKMRKLYCKVWNAFHLDLLNDFLSTFKDI